MPNLNAMGFWELHGFGGNERKRIDTLLGAARLSEYSQQELIARVHDLVEVATAQANDIVQLRIAIFALAEMLGQAGLVEPAALAARVQAIRDSLSPPEATTVAEQATTPYRGAAPAAAPPERTTPCATCGRIIAVSSTLMSERGAVCEDCFAKPA